MIQENTNIWLEVIDNNDNNQQLHCQQNIKGWNLKDKCPNNGDGGGFFKAFLF
jgi:hypothetical protein